MVDTADSARAIVDPREAAESARLRYVADARPGISRKKAREGFTYGADIYGADIVFDLDYRPRASVIMIMSRMIIGLLGFSLTLIFDPAPRPGPDGFHMTPV